jgi:hypothetical protein
LDVHGHDGPLHVLATDAVGHLDHRVVDRPTQSDLRHHPMELARGWVFDLTGHLVESLEEAVPRSEGACQDRQDVGQLLAHLLLPLLPSPHQPCVRDQARAAGDQQDEDDVPQQEGSDDAAGEGAQDDERGELAGLHGELRLFEHRFQSAAEPARRGQPISRLGHPSRNPRGLLGPLLPTPSHQGGKAATLLALRPRRQEHHG